MKKWRVVLHGLEGGLVVQSPHPPSSVKWWRVTEIGNLHTKLTINTDHILLLFEGDGKENT